MEEIPRGLINRLRKKEQRGSKPRCHFLTHGSASEVASRLTSLIKPWGMVRPNDKWMPEGFEKVEECELPQALLKDEFSIPLQLWWLGEIKNLQTPSWDLASTCLIGERDGLLLVEAKAHNKELKAKDKKGCNERSKDSLRHHLQIGNAIDEAKCCIK